MDIKNIRKDYQKGKIDFLNIEKNPISFFIKWFQEALLLDRTDLNACVLSTVDSNNTPFSRVVLLKDVSKDGFVFFTNYNSSKGNNIKNNNKVAVNFFWPELERQIRINGIASKISGILSDEYFAQRPRESQLSAWVSNQSSEIPLDTDFTSVLDSIRKKFDNQDISRPSEWGGYCIIPHRVEFWQGRPSRFHDRLVYILEDDNWRLERLSP